MNLLDKVVQEWSVKTKKGYPDINSKEDMDLFESMFGFRLDEDITLREQDNSQEDISVEDLKKLIDANAGNNRLLQRVYRTLSASSYITKLKEKLIQAGLSKDLLDGRNIFDEIINILQKGKESSIEKLVNFQEQSKLPEKGNLLKIVNGIEESKLLQISSLVGQASSVTIGRGEILLPILYSNVKLKQSGAGDFLIDGKTAELKTNLARLSGQRTSLRYIPFNKEVPKTWAAGLRGDIAVGREKGNIEEVIQNINRFISSNYKNTSIRVSEESIEKEDVVKTLGKAAIDDYINNKKIDIYILMDSNNLDFRVFSPAKKLIDAIDKGEVTFNTQSSPQLTGFSL